MLPGEHPLPDK